MSPTFRPATAKDWEAFFGESPKKSMRAWVMEKDGQVLAIGGVRHMGYTGRPFLFSDIKPEAKKYPVAMIKGALKALEILDAPVLAIASPEEPGSIRLLTRLGFRWYATSSQGEVFQWQPRRRSAA